jgi:radical SAM protein with 4Fe4S-binding SPASM domain
MRVNILRFFTRGQRAPVLQVPRPHPQRLAKLGFDIVHGCQLRCVGCPNSTLMPKIRRIEVADFEQCLDHLDVAEVDLFRLFNFGEPLLHHDLAGILAAIGRRRTLNIGLVEISTNAQYHDFDALAEALATGALGRLVVSCDGDGTPAEYEQLRTPSRWPKLIEFLERAKELRDRHSPYTQLMTRSVCTSAEGRRRWLELLRPLGWEPEFRGWLYLPESASNMTGRAPLVPEGVCQYLRGPTLYVDWDGTVVPCCVHPRAGVLGNLKTQRYSEIFNAAERQAMMSAMQRDRRAMRICGQCEF